MLDHIRGQVKKDPTNPSLQVRLKRFEYKVKGTKYLGEKKNFLIKPEESNPIKDKKDYYRVTYKRYSYYYIGHYDKEKYEKNMERYKKGEIKSRPNGRIWHKLRENDYETTFDRKGHEVIIIRKGIGIKYKNESIF